MKVIPAKVTAMIVTAMQSHCNESHCDDCHCSACSCNERLVTATMVPGKKLCEKASFFVLEWQHDCCSVLLVRTLFFVVAFCVSTAQVVVPSSFATCCFQIALEWLCQSCDGVFSLLLLLSIFPFLSNRLQVLEQVWGQRRVEMI